MSTTTISVPEAAAGDAARKPRGRGRLAVLALLWALAFAAIPLWVRSDEPAWDVHVYMNALRALEAGHDPYADGMAVQRAFHARLAEHPNDAPPYTYVYSPMTLPVLRAAGRMPLALAGTLYWGVYAAAVLAMVFVGLSAATATERRWAMFLGPAAAFFPALLVQDVILSGNVAYIFYGATFACAWWGWRKGQWWPFYAAVLAASCCKAPLLSLLVVPVFSARKQWVPAAATGVAGCALFALQPHVWPVLFKHYLEAVELQFSYNRDFGLSPAGLMAHDASTAATYSRVSAIAYLAGAVPVTLVLYALSRRYLAGRVTLAAWAPVLLVGTVLLNPRIMTYDAAPLTVPMVLIAWRWLAGRMPARAAAMTLTGVFALLNVLLAAVFTNMDVWKHVAGMLIVVVFAAGSADLWRGRGAAVNA